MSDEIGHFENCLQLDANFNCAVPGSQDSGGLDEDDDNNFCVPAADSLLVKINGCFSSDGDWDGQSYRNDWPGTDPQPRQGQGTPPHPGAVHQPADERADQLLDDRLRDRPATDRGGGLAGQPAVLRPDDRSELREPADRRAVLPDLHHDAATTATCTWQEGGPFIPGTTNTFGGSSTTEFGPLLQTVYPAPGFTTVLRYNNFNSGDLRNPCRVSTDH